MALLGTSRTGNLWPGQLSAYRIDAPGEEFVVDPSLPVLDVDPRFPSDQVVIGRGRLVGVKANATIGAGITAPIAGYEHKTILTIADGVAVRPVGYAPYNIFKDWAEKARGVAPIMERNQAIQVPYLAIGGNDSDADREISNTVYGDLNQGDKVTAYCGFAKIQTYANPRTRGMTVKWVPKTVYAQVVVAGSANAIPLDNATYAGFTPRLVAAFDAAGVSIDPASAAFSYNTTSKKWEVDFGSNSVATVIYEFGQDAGMICGEVYGVETLNDLPGYLKWVQDNFGAWARPLTFPMTASTTKTAKAAPTRPNGETRLQGVGGGAFSLESTDGGAAAPVRVDARKAVVVRVDADCKIVDGNGAVVALVDEGDGFATLDRADFLGADYTQGKNYTINPISGIVQLFGVLDTDATPLATGDEAKITVAFYQEAGMRPTPEYGVGQVDLTDGRGVAGIPVGTEPQFAVEGSIGILRVAIH